MTTYLLTYGQMLKTTLVTNASQIQSRIDGLLKAEGIPADQPKQGGLPVWAIILIIVGVVICVIPVCIFLVLLLLGPSIGNVFSNIILDI